MTPVAITQFTLVSALGAGRAATLAALREGRSGLQRRDFDSADLNTWLGVVDGLDDVELAPHLSDYDCRNNRLAELTLRSDDFGVHVRAAAARWGAHRVGVFLGTSTSGILSVELAYRQRDPLDGACHRACTTPVCRTPTRWPATCVRPSACAGRRLSFPPPARPAPRSSRRRRACCTPA